MHQGNDPDDSYLLLLRLVNGIECIFDRDAELVACRDCNSEWELQVNDSHRWCYQWLGQDVFILDSR